MIRGSATSACRIDDGKNRRGGVTETTHQQSRRVGSVSITISGSSFGLVLDNSPGSIVSSSRAGTPENRMGA